MNTLYSPINAPDYLAEQALLELSRLQRAILDLPPESKEVAEDEE